MRKPPAHQRHRPSSSQACASPSQDNVRQVGTRVALAVHQGRQRFRRPKSSSAPRGARVACRAMNVQFISSFAVITSDVDASRRLYVEALGLPLTATGVDEYLHSEQVGGVKHFGVWPLWQAAEACFGTRDWPIDRTRPQASVEFDLESPELVAAAAHELERAGFELVHPA